MTESEYQEIRSQIGRKISIEFYTCSKKIYASNNNFRAYLNYFFKIGAILFLVLIPTILVYVPSKIFNYPNDIKVSLNTKLEESTNSSLDRLDSEINNFHMELYADSLDAYIKKKMASISLTEGDKKQMESNTLSSLEKIIQHSISEEDGLYVLKSGVSDFISSNKNTLQNLNSKTADIENLLNEYGKKIRRQEHGLDALIDDVNSSNEALR